MQASSRDRYLVMVEDIINESIRVKQSLTPVDIATVRDMAREIAAAFETNHRIFIFGNGGSAADAQHIAAEFVNRFQINRRPLPAIALTVDSSILTSIANDSSYEDTFIRQLQALGAPGDIALGISTSGNSPNILKGLRWAHSNGLQTFGWTGASSSEMDTCCDLILHAPSKVTARIQECHITLGHAICALVDEMLFGI
ncbi:MAG: SIS domain-containing protein [Desulfomonilaceae bacterium]